MKTCKIGICGTQSVGKSTLVKSLSKHPKFKNFQTFCEESKKIKNMGISLNQDSTLLGQMVFMGYRAKELIPPFIITDRTIIDVMAFTLSSKTINYSEKEKFTDLAKIVLSDYDYIFYISPEGIEIEDNGIRETDEEYRNEIDFSIKFLSNQYRGLMKNFHTISGTTDERVSQVINIIGL
jgi:nicotinamide riboside kinase